MAEFVNRLEEKQIALGRKVALDLSRGTQSVGLNSGAALSADGFTHKPCFSATPRLDLFFAFALGFCISKAATLVEPGSTRQARVLF